MYQTSQGYCGAGSCDIPSFPSSFQSGGLEQIASSVVSYQAQAPEICYSAQDVSGRSYTSATSIMPLAFSSISNVNSGSFNFNNFSNTNYNNLNEGLAYQQNSTIYQLFSAQENYHFIPDQFLKPGKEGFFVGEADKIKPYIEEAFEKMFSCPFPNDVKISVLDEKKFRKLAPNSGTVGLSINRKKQGFVSEIFVLNDNLARVMLTIGHELGHVLTETLGNAQDEEAKAYSFSLAWMKIIKENNIADLGDAIVLERPAENGLHNVAFAFVQKLLNAGEKAWELYLKLVRGQVSVAWGG